MTHENDAPVKPSGILPLALIVEDEAPVRAMLAAGLEANGYRVEEAATGRAGLDMADSYRPDIVILDLGLPDIDGVEVARRLRSAGETPILVLSARSREKDKVAALDAGADDYVTKPFGFEELLARLRVALRHAAKRASPEGGGEFATGPLKIDLETRRVFVDGAEIRLTAIEYKLLVELVRNAGKVVTHQQLLKAVWGLHGTAHAHYLRIYMGHLRRKLEADPSRPRIFRTEIGVGYRLCEDVF
jgi:two-component system, OmpR family, KDP operon response regulator KdpE